MTVVMNSRSPRERTVRSAALLFRERGVAATGLRDVVDLTLSQQWLAPPDRGSSDLLMAALSAAERVGQRSRPLADVLADLRETVP